MTEPLAPVVRLLVLPVAVGLMSLAGCGAIGATAPVEKSNEVLCLDALGLPVTSAVQLFASPETIPDLRAQSRAVLDSRAPDPKVTESAHDVARKVILLLDTAEGLPADSSLGLLGSGLDALASLAKPIDDVVTAQGNLISVCSEVTGTASPSPSVTAA